MDEFLSRKMMRRLALLAMINSAAVSVVAEQPQASNDAPAKKSLQVADQPAGLRDLLTQGWGGDERYTITVQPRATKVASPKATKQAAVQESTLTSERAPAQEVAREQEPVRPLPQVTPEPEAASSEAAGSAAAPDVTGSKSPIALANDSASKAAQPSLADLLRQTPGFSEHVAMPKQKVADAVKPKSPTAPESTAAVTTARPTVIPQEMPAADAPLETPKLVVREPVTDEGQAIPAAPLKQLAALPALNEIGIGDAKSVSESEEPTFIFPTPGKNNRPAVKSQVVAVAPAKEPESRASEPQQLTPAPATPGLAAQPPESTRGLEMPEFARRQSEVLRETAAKQGLSLLASGPIDLPRRVEVAVPLPPPEISEQTKVHAKQLQNVAQDMLRSAHSLMWRGANYSARKKTLGALRSVVAMRDAIDGGNTHAQELDLAIDAVRESQEFGTGVETVDNATLKRLVAVHKTPVLKNQPLENVSPLSAMAAYLEFAQDKLVAASGDHHEASYALQLMGIIEKRVNGKLNPHAVATAMTYHRAAVDIDSSNSLAYYELGKTYYEQGLPEAAANAFARSVELGPSREGYEMLMTTARQLGDIDTVHVCKRTLQDNTLPSGLPVVELDPTLFAATSRIQHTPRPPKPKQVQAQTISTQHASSKPKHTVHAAKHKTTKPSSGVSTVSRIRNWFSRD